MTKRNPKRRGGCLSVLLALAVGGIVLWTGWEGNKLPSLQSPAPDTVPSYTPSSEALVLTPEPADYIPLRHYRSTLTPAEQELYDIVEAAVGCFAPSVEGIQGFSTQKIFEIAGFVLYDHPEYFWYSGEIYATTTSFGSTAMADLDFSYTMTPEEAAETQISIRHVADDYLQNMAELNAREKVEYVYHRLGADTLYDSDYNDQSFCTVLLDHVGLFRSFLFGWSHPIFIIKRLILFTIIPSGTSNPK